MAQVFDSLHAIAEASCQLMLRRLDQGALCDLIYFSDDYVAFGAIPALLSRGVQIPKTVRIVTLFNRGFGPVCPVSLARLEFDHAAHARAIGESVMSWFRSGRFPATQPFTPLYVRGDSFPLA